MGWAPPAPEEEQTVPMKKPTQHLIAEVPHACVGMEAGTHSIWISEQLEQLGHEVRRAR
jgi:transposase